MFTARWFIGLNEAAPCLNLRKAVFGSEPDWYDGIAAHLLVCELPDADVPDESQADPVAAARMYPDGMDTRIDSISVREDKRGMRYGDLCTRMLLFKAEQLIPARILARVPETMTAYYAGFGFAPLGPAEDGFVEMAVNRGEIIWDSMCRHG